MTKQQIALARKNGTIDALYEQMVDKLIRKRYSVSNEFAILRQKDTKPADFATYNRYVESCKVEARTILGLNGSED